ncbi:MAG TPA: LAGLIDADG family homing endonuclease [Mycobacterium sp.]|nr:LAGLIDADG family homing endonuclease [Mycobacterium sp.]
MTLATFIPKASNAKRAAGSDGNCTEAVAMKQRIVAMVDNAAKNQPRNLQKAIGPSEVGHPCTRQVAMKVAGVEPNPDWNDPMPSIIGTAFHSWMEKHLDPSEWIPEKRVHVDGRGLWGSSDAYHIPTRTVVDWKMLGVTMWRDWTGGYVNGTYRVQAHSYGKGFRRAGYPVERVAVAVFCRSKPLQDLYVWSEPWDESVADQALQRLEQIKTYVAATGASDSNRQPLLAIEPTAGDGCYFCLASETEVVTRQGVRPIGQLAGGNHELLIPSHTAKSGKGVWRSVPVRSYGVQPLHKVHLRRNRQEKVVYATAEHRWITDKGDVATTTELTPGQILASVRATTVNDPAVIAPAVAQGFTYGDGARGQGQRPASLPIYGRSHKSVMIPWFGPVKVTETVTADGDTMKRIHSLPRFWKVLPPIDESRSFLLSWLAGYFAADGSVSVAGQASLASADRSALEFVRDIAAICGIRHGIIHTTSRNGTRSTPSDLYSLTLHARDLPSWFWMLPHHQERVADYVSTEAKSPQVWRVVEVVPTGRVEEVFCAEVEGVAAFGLADGLTTGNCLFGGQTRDGRCDRKA